MITNRIILLFALIAACSSCKTINMYSNLDTGNVEDLLDDSRDLHIIKVDDKISLSIWNHDDLSVGSVFTIYNSNEAYGKWILVDENGEIKLPRIGGVSIAGLTCTQAADSLAVQYSEYLKDPVIVVKVLNKEVTVLGEVRTPGTYILEKENNSLTHIIGQAQGFEKYADIQHVKIVRDGIGYPIDMSNSHDTLLHKINLKADDIVYIPSRRGKRFEEKAPVIIPFASAVTAIALVFSIISR